MAMGSHTAHKIDYSVDSAARNGGKRFFLDFPFLAALRYPWVCSRCQTFFLLFVGQNAGMLPYRVVEVIPFQFYIILNLVTRGEDLLEANSAHA